MEPKSDFYVINNICTRPNVDSGLWVLFLLPLSLMISTLKHHVPISTSYKMTTLLSVGLLLNSIIIVFQKYHNQRFRTFNRWTVLLSVIMTVLFSFCFHKGLMFSVWSGLFGTVIYFRIYVFILNKFKNCFTLGEAGFVCQSIIIVFYCTLNNIIDSVYMTSGTDIQISTLIMQVGLLGIEVISSAIYFLNIKNSKSFYLLSCFVICIIILSLHILLNKSPILWILNLTLRDWSTVKLLIFWMFCIGIAVLIINNQTTYARKASTSIRKIFHLLTVVVYVPGLLYGCSLLYFASGVMLCIFFVLEIIRILNIPPLGQHLQESFTVFSDEKDTGLLALTPIYLLVGCSLPLWIHPSPCDITDSATFNLLPLLSGLLSIGIGDTAASVIGSNYGHYFWPGVLENLLIEQYSKLCFAILVTSLVEARTTQIDNLVLPVIEYVILL